MDIGYWFMLCSILGGSSGVLVGGFISDAVVQKLGTDIYINIYKNQTHLKSNFQNIETFLKSFN